MRNPYKVTFTDLISEVERELAMRRKMYPKWQLNRTISPETAYHRIHIMETILYLLKKNAPNPPKQLDLFATFQESKIL